MDLVNDDLKHPSPQSLFYFIYIFFLGGGGVEGGTNSVLYQERNKKH